MSKTIDGTADVRDRAAEYNNQKSLEERKDAKIPYLAAQITTIRNIRETNKAEYQRTDRALMVWQSNLERDLEKLLTEQEVQNDTV